FAVGANQPPNYRPGVDPSNQADPAGGVRGGIPESKKIDRSQKLLTAKYAKRAQRTQKKTQRLRDRNACGFVFLSELCGFSLRSLRLRALPQRDAKTAQRSKGKLGS